MHLANIRLDNFKNYEELYLDCLPTINSLVGENGSGKTNLLDAIHYLSLSKSAFNHVDSQNIRHEATYFVIEGEFCLEEDSYRVLCGVQKGQAKQLKLNKVPYERISEHIGRFPIVMISPQDSDLIREGSEARRRFFDSLWSQLDPLYLQELMQYNKTLRQRNQLLKDAFEKNFLDKDLLEIYDRSILQLGRIIKDKRTAFIQTFHPDFQAHYQYLSNQKEQTTIRYRSDFQDEQYESRFREQQTKDLHVQRTTYGIHRDDYKFGIEERSLKRFGSQGQQKSFLIALKLSQFQMIERYKKVKAILLLDDIFDKLDELRMAKLIELVSQQTFGQIFISDARPERTEQILEKIASPARIFEIKEGKLLRVIG